MSQQQPTQPPPQVSLKCRNPKCDSITAEVIPHPYPGSRMYRCVRCKHTWAINVGGQLDLRRL